MDKKAVCGVFNIERVDTQWILSYLEILEIKHTKLIIDEITFSGIISLICKATRFSYVEDEDEILEKLKLDFLRYYDEPCEIVLEKKLSRKELLKQARDILSGSLEEELQRIFISQTEKQFSGHPVHYILEAESRDECKKMLQILLSALYHVGPSFYAHGVHKQSRHGKNHGCTVIFTDYERERTIIRGKAV